jgi:hypothetical protein
MSGDMTKRLIRSFNAFLKEQDGGENELVLIEDELAKRKRDKGKEEEKKAENGSKSKRKRSKKPNSPGVLDKLPRELQAKIMRELVVSGDLTSLWPLMASPDTRPLLYEVDKILLRENRKPDDRAGSSETARLKGLDSVIERRWAILLSKWLNNREDTPANIEDPIIEGVTSWRLVLESALQMGMEETAKKLFSLEKYGELWPTSTDDTKELGIVLSREMKSYFDASKSLPSAQRLRRERKVSRMIERLVWQFGGFLGEDNEDGFFRKVFTTASTLEDKRVFFSIFYRYFNAFLQDLTPASLLELLGALENLEGEEYVAELERFLIFIAGDVERIFSLDMGDLQLLDYYALDHRNKEGERDVDLKIAKSWFQYVDIPDNFLVEFMKLKGTRLDEFLDLAFAYQPAEISKQAKEFLDTNADVRTMQTDAYASVWRSARRNGLLENSDVSSIARPAFKQIARQTGRFYDKSNMNTLLNLFTSAYAITNEPLQIIFQKIVDNKGNKRVLNSLYETAQTLVWDGRSKLDMDQVSRLLLSSVKNKATRLFVALVSMYPGIPTSFLDDLLGRLVRRMEGGQIGNEYELMARSLIQKGLVTEEAVAKLSEPQRARFQDLFPYKMGVQRTPLPAQTRPRVLHTPKRKRRPFIRKPGLFNSMTAFSFLQEVDGVEKQRRLERGTETQQILLLEKEKDESGSKSLVPTQLFRSMDLTDDEPPPASASVSSCIQCGADDPFFFSQEKPYVHYCKGCVELL